MDILLIITALFIATETINPGVDDAKKIQKNEEIAETVETEPPEEIISESQAEVEAQTESEEEVPEEEPLENNKVDGEANENEES